MSQLPATQPVGQIELRVPPSFRLNSLELFAWQAQLHEYELMLISTPVDCWHPVPPIPVKGRVRSIQQIDKAIEWLTKEWSPNPNRHPGKALWELSKSEGTARTIAFFRRHILDGDVFWAGRKDDPKDKWLLVAMHTREDGTRYGHVLPSASPIGPLDDSGNHIVPEGCPHEGYVWKKDFPYTMYDDERQVGLLDGLPLEQTLYRIARAWQEGKHDLF